MDLSNNRWNFCYGAFILLYNKHGTTLALVRPSSQLTLRVQYRCMSRLLLIIEIGRGEDARSLFLVLIQLLQSLGKWTT